MGGGIMQLIAYGAQDIYLTGNPQITFFKIVYRRHTNFSMETIKQSISGQSFIGIDNINNKATVTISRNGDLVTGIYVATKQTDTNNLIGICGDNLVEDVEIEIGGQRIDKHYKEWNQIWDELTTPVSKSEGYKYMTGSFNNSLVLGSETKQEMVHYPLKFWFCRNPGLALPLIALQYHEIQLKFTWGVGKYNTSSSDNLTRTNNKTDSGGLTEQHSVEVWADYVYLDTDERRRFSQVSHEYLIEQLQIQKEKDVSSESFKLNLEHPIKELIWTTPQTTPFTDQKIKLSINGHDRFFERNKEYFTLEQPYKHHTSIPGYNIKETEHPIMLNESIFSKDYTYENISGNLSSIVGDNIFTNKKLTNKTSSTSPLSSDAVNTFLFVSSGDSANPSIEFKIGDIVRINYYKISDVQRNDSDGDFNLQTKTVQRTYGGNGLGTTSNISLRIEMLPIKESTTMGNTALTNGTWRDNIVKKIAKAEVAVAIDSGSNSFFVTAATGGAIEIGDTVTVGGITTTVAGPLAADGEQPAPTNIDPATDAIYTEVTGPPILPAGRFLIYIRTTTTSSVAASTAATPVILDFDRSHADTYTTPTTTATLHAGIQHDNHSSTDGSEWTYHEDIVPASSRPRPVTLHTKVESTDDNSLTAADHSIHSELNSSFLTQLEVTGNYKDKNVENIVRNLTVLEVFKSSTLVPGKTIYEIKFNDNMGVSGDATNALNHRVSFEIIARVQNPVSRCSQLKKDIYVYSFCLEPEEHQPSGSCNFSRIDSAKLMFSSSGSISNIYAVNYNVLRIMSGMGGLAYSS